MSKMKLSKSVVSVVSVLSLLFIGCSDRTNVVDVDNVDTVELNDIRSDVRIIPVKCGVPMDEIDRSIAYDDYLFLLGMSWKKIYCVRTDTVISILDAAGRGRGEYSTIDDFAYSQDEHILYVIADGKLMKYSVPDMEFISSIDIGVTSRRMIFLNPDEIMMCASFIEENGKDVYSGLCRVSSKTGQVLERCHDLDFVAKRMMMPWDLTPMPDGIVFPHNSLTRNSILFYDTAKGTTKELFSFSFNSRWRVPKRLVRLARKDRMFFAMDITKETMHLEGGHFPSLSESGLVFWCFPIEDDNARQVAVFVKDGNLTCRSYTIAGTDLGISPNFLHNGYCVDYINSASFDNVDETSLSPLGLELKRAADAQPFDNPVFLYFKVD